MTPDSSQSGSTMQGRRVPNDEWYHRMAHGKIEPGDYGCQPGRSAAEAAGTGGLSGASGGRRDPSKSQKRKRPMTHPAIQLCVCRHPKGDHVSAGTSWPNPPVYGLCMVPGCKCREFRIEPTRKAAA